MDILTASTFSIPRSVLLQEVNLFVLNLLLIESTRDKVRSSDVMFVAVEE